MERTYARALLNLLSRGADEGKMVSNLVAHLKSVGRMKLLPRIASELRAMGMQTQSLTPTVEVAREKDSASALKAAHLLGVDAKHAHINHSLLSGFRARVGGTLIDHSGKRALIELYRKVIS
jgi:F0F1-type ATP synthase delta subunit